MPSEEVNLISYPVDNAFVKSKLAEVNFTRTGKSVKSASTFVSSIVIFFYKTSPLASPGRGKQWLFVLIEEIKKWLEKN